MAQLRSRRGGRRYGGLGGPKTRVRDRPPGGRPEFQGLSKPPARTPEGFPGDSFPPPTPFVPGEISLPPGLKGADDYAQGAEHRDERIASLLEAGIASSGEREDREREDFLEWRGPQWFWDDFRGWMDNFKDWYFGDPFPYQEEVPPKLPVNPPSGSWLDDFKEWAEEHWLDWYFGDPFPYQE